MSNFKRSKEPKQLNLGHVLLENPKELYIYYIVLTIIPEKLSIQRLFISRTFLVL